MKEQSSKLASWQVDKKALRNYPAEWEKQRTVWLSWPHNEKEWGKNRLPKIKKFYEKLIDLILNFQNVNLIFPNEDVLKETLSSQLLIPSSKRFSLKKLIIPNNDIWIRDYGPFFLREKNNKRKNQIILDFEFNGWGRKYPPWNLDNKIPKEIANYLGIKEIESYPIILEGGAVEFSGSGVLITTEQCLLNKNRNPKLNKNQIELLLKQAFNIEEIIWLKQGLEGDHTDGHIDDFVRFIGPRKVIICQTNNKKDKNHEHLKESREVLKKWKHTQKNYKLELIEIPLPERMNLNGKRLPNSYANFIFVNGGLIVPTFDCKTDKIALKTFKKIFPALKVMGIDCSLLIEEGGGVHCISKQEPL